MKFREMGLYKMVVERKSLYETGVFKMEFTVVFGLLLLEGGLRLNWVTGPSQFSISAAKVQERNAHVS